MYNRVKKQKEQGRETKGSTKIGREGDYGREDVILFVIHPLTNFTIYKDLGVMI